MRLTSWMDSFQRNLVQGLIRRRNCRSRQNAPSTVERLEDRSLLAATWVEQGPSTANNGQTEAIANNEVVGAVNVVLTHPTDANTVYVGGVNGGVWRTRNATLGDPLWTSIFDQQSSISIGAMAMDPSNPNWILAGFGNTSSFSLVGGNRTGVALTTDGGDSWTEFNAPVLQNRNVIAVQVRGDMLLAAANGNAGVGGGLFRRANAAANFVTISGTGGLPVGALFDLVGDPTNANRFYASVQSNGLYRSDDGGVNWVNVSSGDATFNTSITSGSNNNTEMAVASNGRIFTAVMLNGRLNYWDSATPKGEPGPPWTCRKPQRGAAASSACNLGNIRADKATSISHWPLIPATPIWSTSVATGNRRRGRTEWNSPRTMAFPIPSAPTTILGDCSEEIPPSRPPEPHRRRSGPI